MNISHIMKPESLSSNSSMSLLSRLEDSNDSDPQLGPKRFGGKHKAESEIKAEMKKKHGGEVIEASGIKAIS